MKIENYHPPKSSFLSVNKDMKLLIDKILSNDRLCNLLHYTTKDALSREALSDEEKINMFKKEIKIVPKFYVDKSVLNYIIISFDNFVESENPEFRDNIIEFDIVCHFDQWGLTDFDLRPYRIAAELDTMLNKQKLTGIGKIEFLGANQIVLNDEFAGLCLMYTTYHGEEDKKQMLNPQEQQQFVSDFKRMIEIQKEQAKEYPNGLQASLNMRD